MIRDLSRLTAAEYDVLIVGGGIYGLAIAYDAAQRGLSVALIERGDFGEATSFNHLKTIHGGLRYLQSADFSRMRESIRERRAFARIAPHLVSPLGFVMPTRRSLTRGRLAMRAALLLDAFVAVDRNAGLRATHRLEPGRVISREECRQLFNGMVPDAVTGGALWYDYQMAQADRLTLAFALAADAHGAALANYAEAIELLRDGSDLRGVRVHDRLGNGGVDVRARLVVNAAGPWTSELLARWGMGRQWPMVKAMNVVTKRPAGPLALVAPTPQGRALVLIPWHGRSVIGTGESSQLCGPADQEVTAAELAAFLDEVNETFPGLQLERHDVSLVHRGVVPAVVRNGRPVLQGHSQILDHAHDGLSGLVSVVGVKYTTARAVAERAVDLVLKKLARLPVRSRTAKVPLPGGDLSNVDTAARELTRSRAGSADEEAARRLVAMYGTRSRAVLELAASTSGLDSRIVPAHPVLRAEILHAVRVEMAHTLIDVVVRRTALGAAGHPGEQVARACADLLKMELGWPETRTTSELEALRRFYAPAEVG